MDSLRLDLPCHRLLEFDQVTFTQLGKSTIHVHMYALCIPSLLIVVRCNSSKLLSSEILVLMDSWLDLPTTTHLKHV